MFFKNYCKGFNFCLCIYTTSRIIRAVDENGSCLFIEGCFYCFYIKAEVRLCLYFNKFTAVVFNIMLVFS